MILMHLDRLLEDGENIESSSKLVTNGCYHPNKRVIENSGKRMF